MKRKKLVVVGLLILVLVIVGAACWLFRVVHRDYLSGELISHYFFGRLTRIDLDLDKDGDLEQQLLYRWNASYQGEICGVPLPQYRESRLDVDGDGRFDTWMFNRGLVVSNIGYLDYAIDTNGDGEPDFSFTSRAWASDEADKIARTKRSFGVIPDEEWPESDNPFEQSKIRLIEVLNRKLEKAWDVKLDDDILVLKSKSKLKLVSSPPGSPLTLTDEWKKDFFWDYYQLRFRLGQHVTTNDFKTMYSKYWKAEKQLSAEKRKLAAGGIFMLKGRLSPKGGKQETIVDELYRKYSTLMILYPDYWYEYLSIYSLFTDYNRAVNEHDLDDVQDVLDDTFNEYVNL